MKFFVICDNNETRMFESFEEAACFIEELDLQVENVAVYTAKDEVNELVFVK